WIIRFPEEFPMKALVDPHGRLEVRPCVRLRCRRTEPFRGGNNDRRALLALMSRPPVDGIKDTDPGDAGMPLGPNTLGDAVIPAIEEIATTHEGPLGMPLLHEFRG